MDNIKQFIYNYNIKCFIYKFFQNFYIYDNMVKIYHKIYHKMDIFYDYIINGYI